MATEEDHEHGVDQMKVLIKKAKRAMHETIMEDPNKDYNDVYKEALADVQVQIGKLWSILLQITFLDTPVLPHMRILHSFRSTVHLPHK